MDLILRTELTQEAFSKTDLASLLNESGAEIFLGENQKITQIKEWKFQNVKTENDGVAFFGKVDSENLTSENFQNDFDGNSDNIEENGERFFLFSLSEVFKKCDFFGENFLGECVYLFCFSVSETIQCGKTLPAVGFGGVYFFCQKDLKSEKLKIEKIIFLPQELFSRCASNKPKIEQAQLQGKSVKKGLFGSKSLSFTRACAVYKFFCKKDPFDCDDEKIRNLDMFDKNFLPLEKCVFGIDLELAFAVNNSLCLSADFEENSSQKIVSVAKRKKINEKKSAKNAFEKNVVENFPLKNLLCEIEKSKSSEKSKSQKNDFQKISAELLEFQKSQKKFLQKQKIRISLSRFFRRDKKSLFIFVAFFLISFFIASDFYKAQKFFATSLGQTAQESARILFCGVHNVDATIVDKIIFGKKMRSMEEIISGLFVKYRTREVMDGKPPVKNVASWLLQKNRQDVWIFGLTNFRLDGKNFDLTKPVPIRAQKLKPLSKENGGGIRGDQKFVTAEYFLVRTDSDFLLTIIKTKDTLKMEWKKNRWRATQIESESSAKTVPFKDFQRDYENALEIFFDDVQSATNFLRKKYEWLPLEDEILCQKMFVTNNEK